MEILNEIVDEDNKHKSINNNSSSLQTSNFHTDSSLTPSKKVCGEQSTSTSTSMTTSSTTTKQRTYMLTTELLMSKVEVTIAKFLL